MHHARILVGSQIRTILMPIPPTTQAIRHTHSLATMLIMMPTIRHGLGRLMDTQRTMLYYTTRQMEHGRFKIHTEQPVFHIMFHVLEEPLLVQLLALFHVLLPRPQPLQ